MLMSGRRHGRTSSSRAGGRRRRPAEPRLSSTTYPQVTPLLLLLLLLLLPPPPPPPPPRCSCARRGRPGHASAGAAGGAAGLALRRRCALSGARFWKSRRAGSTPRALASRRRFARAAEDASSSHSTLRAGGGFRVLGAGERPAGRLHPIRNRVLLMHRPAAPTLPNRVLLMHPGGVHLSGTALRICSHARKTCRRNGSNAGGCQGVMHVGKGSCAVRSAGARAPALKGRGGRQTVGAIL